MKLKKAFSALVATTLIASGSIAMNAISLFTPLTQTANASTNYCKGKTFIARALFRVNVRAERSTSSRVVKVLNPGTYAFTTWEEGQFVNDIVTGKPNNMWYKLADGSGWIAGAVLSGYPPTTGCPTPPVSSNWKLPWATRVTGNVDLSRGWHTDGYRIKAIDIRLPANTPVLAPIDSKVVSQCNAGNNHRAILLQASNGQRYSMIHVTTSNISVGKTYRKGDRIGVIAGDRPWNNCAKSTGPHLHLGLPSQNFSIGGYTLSPTSLPSSMTARD